MKRSKCSESQIVGTMKKAGAGLQVTKVCRRHGISDATYHKWKSKQSGL